MNILEAIKDRELGFRSFLSPSSGLRTWRPWLSALAVIYGVPLERRSARALVRKCTGRDPRKLPPDGFNEALLLCGRRSGKSKIAAVVGAFETLFGGHEQRLSPGEQGLVVIVSPSKRQSQVIFRYLRSIFDAPILRGEIAAETATSFTLANGLRVEPITGDYRVVRAFTVVAAICDELAFMGVDEGTKVKSDTELIRALRPALLTTGGKLIGLTTPYMPRGFCHRAWKQHFGNDRGRMLVWRAPSTTMNPTIRQADVDAALAEDLAAAKSEFLAEWREDIAAYLPREVIEPLVVRGRQELLPRRDITYAAFADLSGGRSDDAALAIGHRDRQGGKVILDLLRRWQPPFNPAAVVTEMAGLIREYGIARVHADAYGASFVSEGFQREGVRLIPAKPKNELYVNAIAPLCSGNVELLDHPALVDQLCSLERRTRSGGRDAIDHPAGAKDDLANALCGVLSVVSSPKRIAGALGGSAARSLAIRLGNF